MWYYRAFLSLLLAFFVVPTAQSDEQEWDTLKTLLEQATTPEGIGAARTYVESMSAEELIQVGRQGSREIETRCEPHDWDAASIEMAFFTLCYPQNSNGLQDIAPIISEIKLKTGSQFWRRFLVHAVSSDWLAFLTDDQCWQVIEVFGKVLNDPTDSLHVRDKIPLGLARLLSKVCPGRDKDDSGRTEKANGGNEGRIRGIIEGCAKTFNDACTPVELQIAILAGLLNCHKAGLPGSYITNDVVLHALEEFSEYEEELWDLLALCAVLELDIGGADSMVEQMIAQASDSATISKLNHIRLIRQQRRNSENKNQGGQ